MNTVYVGLSGGVDSAVSAALLQEEGHAVTGVFIKIWSPEFLECTWREDRLEAKRVAAHLGIPFLEIDLSQEYLDTVVSDMLENYKKGFTPNPDVLCNRTIKFGAFSKWAFEKGADRVATGHYARVEVRDGRKALLKGIDASKDQSYFLYRLTHTDLDRVLFPVGVFTKPEIRAKAKAYKLPNAERPDSQGLCFVGDVSLQEFLARFITLKKGTLLDEQGVLIGEHDGSALYTIGQRHGLHLVPSAPAGPYYVTRIDTLDNIVYASKRKLDTMHTRATLADVHWIHGHVHTVEAVPRYHARASQACVSEGEQITAQFSEAVSLTRGQSLVFYNDDECLGGAVIQDVQ